MDRPIVRQHKRFTIFISPFKQRRGLFRRKQNHHSWVSVSITFKVGQYPIIEFYSHSLRDFLKRRAGSGGEVSYVPLQDGITKRIYLVLAEMREPSDPEAFLNELETEVSEQLEVFA